VHGDEEDELEWWEHRHPGASAVLGLALQSRPSRAPAALPGGDLAGSASRASCSSPPGRRRTGLRRRSPPAVRLRLAQAAAIGNSPALTVSRLIETERPRPRRTWSTPWRGSSRSAIPAKCLRAAARLRPVRSALHPGTRPEMVPLAGADRGSARRPRRLRPTSSPTPTSKRIEMPQVDVSSSMIPRARRRRPGRSATSSPIPGARADRGRGPLSLDLRGAWVLWVAVMNRDWSRLLRAAGHEARGSHWPRSAPTSWLRTSSSSTWRTWSGTPMAFRDLPRARTRRHVQAIAEEGRACPQARTEGLLPEGRRRGQGREGDWDPAGLSRRGLGTCSRPRRARSIASSSCGGQVPRSARLVLTGTAVNTLVDSASSGAVSSAGEERSGWAAAEVMGSIPIGSTRQAARPRLL